MSELSELSQARVRSGHSLRVLDSKSEEDQQLVRKAPMLMEYASDVSKHRFDEVLDGLRGLNIPFTVDPCLVRGLDY